MIGIVTRYRKHDSTFAALSLTRRFDALGVKYELYKQDWRVNAVDPSFDHKLSNELFYKWLRKTKMVIWTAPIDELFNYALRKRNVKSILYTSWDDLEPFDEQVLESFSQIFMPSVVQAMTLRDKFKLPNVSVLPYNCGMPITRKNKNVTPGIIKLFLSLYGNQLKNIELAAVLLLADIAKDRKDVVITIACCGGLAPLTIKELNKLSKIIGDNFKVINKPWHEQVVEMSKQDLTIWPTKCDGFGVVGLTSLHMGTPVLSWDILPISEYLSAGRNSLLVSSDVEHSWLGMPKVIPNYKEFDRILRWLIDKPTALGELRKFTHERIQSKILTFNKTIDSILPIF